MNDELFALGIYSGAIALAALAGGAIPLFFRLRGRRTELLLSFSAGVMLGAAFFHMLPEALREAGLGGLSVVVLGFLVLFVLERYVLVHVCEEPEEGCEVHNTMGMAAFVGLSVHTLFDGIALGSSLAAGVGGLVFIAVVAHKVPSSLTLASILDHEHYKRGRILAMLVAFALMVPAGALIYLLIRDLVPFENLTPYTLAFSGGTFLHLSLSDLLPTVHRSGKAARLPTVISLLVGVGLMYGLSHLGHSH
ncbi:MAG: ZIP family metal transporter [Myxococcales bacterium]